MLFNFQYNVCVLHWYCQHIKMVCLVTETVCILLWILHLYRMIFPRVTTQTNHCILNRWPWSVLKKAETVRLKTLCYSQSKLTDIQLSTLLSELNYKCTCVFSQHSEIKKIFNSWSENLSWNVVIFLSYLFLFEADKYLFKRTDNLIHADNTSPLVFTKLWYFKY